ncbi:MAG: hypothetical protein QCI38_06255, partial [Candidatus Thermoplasmatota archaeon]|nr:hypothetical protein [Candidatus Thermoplasmatota archaeon]
KFFGLGAQDTIATKTYYVGEPSSLEAWVYGTILVAVGFLTVLMVLSARQSKRPAPKWKK